MELKWIIQNDLDEKTVREFAKKLNIPNAIASILIRRGIDCYDKAKYFFRAGLEDLYDPFLFTDMEKATKRIIKAKECNEKILIYGDYDVDGITSVSLLYLICKTLNLDVSFYIPNRLHEGYGISLAGIEEAGQKGISLVISVDCGITAIEEIQYAKTLGIDVIICDHHEPGSALPDAYAILNPKRKNTTYPFRDLAGVGVSYKLAHALLKVADIEEEIIKEFVDLVAIGSAADIVPLIEENRIFVREGLQKINESSRPGLVALLESSGLRNKEISTGQVVFIIAPRINAVGRMGNAERAVRLLTTNNYQQAKNIAAILESENRERKNVDELTFKEAQEMVESQYDLKDYAGLVLDMDGWHPGVIGIVASRIVEKFYRPTIMISTEDGTGKGSARSIPGFDIYVALKECEDLLIGFGGHKYAAGLTIKQENIGRFRERFNEIADELLTPEMLIPKLHIESEIKFKDINSRFIRLLKYMAPYGPQNMRPVFLSRNLQVVGTPSIVGKNHLKFKVQQDNIVIDVIGFNLGNKLYRIAPGEKNLDLVYVIEENVFSGRTTLQLRIKDLR